LRLTAAGSRLYFTARDDAHGRELWTSDGTFDGTRLVADLNPGIRSAMAIGPIDPLVVSVGRVYFDADDGVHGIEPWVLTVEP
jgi:ELWxxDGT repeat protein